MTRLEALRTANPTLPILPIASPEFARYGQVISEIDTSEIVKAALICEQMPADGSRYLPVVEALDSMPAATQIRQLLWGQLDAQFGLCWGHSHQLNALEWHTCSEINIGITDLVLLLADRRDMKDGKIDSSQVQAFYLAQGEIIEVYATTLHFCPCEITPAGFSCLVVLPRGTNSPLNTDCPKPPLLWAKNKWLIAHTENTPLLARGAKAGISGVNLSLTPIISSALD